MKLVFEHYFAASPDALFRFHERYENLVLLQRGWSSFRLISHPDAVRLGGVFRVQEGFGPLFIDLAFEHHLFEPAHRFGERQISGPFHCFVHTHEFEERPGGALLRDTLDFTVPLWLGGSLTEKIVVAPKLRQWFAYRHAELEKIIAEGLLTRTVS